MRSASWPRGTALRGAASSQSMMSAPFARPRRMREIQSELPEIYRRVRRPALFLARTEAPQRVTPSAKAAGFVLAKP